MLMENQGGEKPGDEAEDESLQQRHGALSLRPRGKANKLVVRGIERRRTSCDATHARVTNRQFAKGGKQC